VNSSSLGAELRKYRALAIALVLTLFIAVGLFVQFLSIDRTRAQTDFRTNADQAATISGMRIALLLERLEMLGRNYLLLGTNDTQHLSALKDLGIDLEHLSICGRDNDSIQVLHSANSQVTSPCHEAGGQPQNSVPYSQLDNIETEVRVASSPSSNESFIVVPDGNGYRE